MKRNTMTAIIACLLLCILAFTSCGGTATPATSTSESTTGTPKSTEAQTEVQTEHVHTPAGKYTIDKEATCSVAGSQSYHCITCGEIIADTAVEIPADPSQHMYRWSAEHEASLFAVGTNKGVCAICEGVTTEEIAKTEPLIYYSGMDATARGSLSYVSGTTINYKKRVQELADNAGLTYYPSEVSSNGNDLLIECSFLWNETLADIGDVFTIMFIEDYNLFNIDLKTGDISSREREGDVITYPLGSDKVVNIGSYGWHRIAARMHMDAEIVNNDIKYTYTATCYLDGVKIIEVDKTAFVLTKVTSKVDARLYDPAVVDGKIDYAPITLVNQVRFMHEAFFKEGKNSYLVLADLYATCGTEFVQKVVPATSVTSGTLTVAEGVTLPADVYYAIQ